MSPRYYPQLIPWLKAHAKTLGLAAALGLGFPACAGDEETGEPVEAQDGVTGESPEGADSGSAEEADPEAVAEEGSAAPIAETDIAGESESGSADGGLEGDPASSGAAGDTAPPPDVMDPATETVDAEFGEGDTPPPIVSDTGATPEAAPADMAPEASLASMPPPASDMGSAGMGSIAPGVVASPGAVMNLGNGAANWTPAAASSGSGDQNVYIVVHGDTIGRIAHKIYGSMGQWKALVELNGMKKPYVIFPGDTVRFTASNAKAQAFAQKHSNAKKMFTVRKGDTLSGIAAQLYGSAFAWKTLLTYNKDKINNPNVIPVGMKLAYVDSGNASPGPSKKALKAKAKMKTAKKAKAVKTAKAAAKAKKPAPVEAPEPEVVKADMAPASSPEAATEDVIDAAPEAANDAFPEKAAEPAAESVPQPAEDAAPVAEPAPETEEELEE